MTNPILLIGGSGYCGSYLARGLRNAGHAIVTLDLREGSDFMEDYRCPSPAVESITKEAPAVLWFAGRSTVKSASEDPLDALDSNCIGLIALRSRMAPAAHLVYASSASVYTAVGTASPTPPLSDEDCLLPVAGNNPYDRSKLAFDFIQQGFLSNCLGLRMGTVAGWGVSASSTRADTCFNAMNISALQNGEVRVSQGQAWRTILFLPDLLDIVKAVLASPPSYPILNAGSMSLTIGSLAERIAAYQDATITEYKDASPTAYSFCLDLSRQRSLLGRNPTVDFPAHCEEFRVNHRQIKRSLAPFAKQDLTRL